jgi:hypothetical protein
MLLKGDKEMKNRTVQQCDHVRVSTIAKVIGVVAVAASAVAFATHFKALKRLVEISRM